MGKQYGILEETDINTKSGNSFEIGWAFKPTRNIYCFGFKLRKPSANSLVANLWELSTQKNIYRSKSIDVAGGLDWVSILIDTPILLEKDKTYIITTYTESNYYAGTASKFSFNPRITFIEGRFHNSKNNFPTGYLATAIWPCIDIIFIDDVNYLVYSENKYYTVINDELSEITVENLTASTFEEYGVEKISSDLLKTLVNPKLYAWCEDKDILSNLKCGIKATPKPQILYSDKCDLTDETILGIENLESTFEGSPLLAMSFDEKQTWEAFNGTEWVTLQEDTTGSIPNVYGGLSVDQWAEKLNGVTSIYFRVVIPTAADKVASIKLNFLN